MPDETVATNLDQFVNTLIELSGLELSAAVKVQQEALTVDLTGQDVPFLLGRNGELLNSFEYLANKIYGRQLSPDSSGAISKILFDSEGFRSMRERELRLMAKHAAERVRTSKSPFTF